MTCYSRGYEVKWVTGKGVQRVHRLIAAEMLGRDLLPGEEVHHRNGDRADNRPENLEVLPSHREHAFYHRLTKCKRGHDLTDPGNIRIATDTGRRRCRRCWLDKTRESRLRRKAA